MRLFLDESGTSAERSALVLLEVPEFADYFLNIILTPKKRLPPYLENVFESTNGEFKFSAFMNEYRKTKDERLTAFLKDRLRRLCSLDLSIYYAVYENDSPETTLKESEYLLNRFGLNRYSDLFGKHLEIIADKQFYPKHKCFELFRAHELIVARIRNQPEAKNTGVNYMKTPILIGNSSKVKGLQAADLFAGALFQKYYRGNEEFETIFCNKIRGQRTSFGESRNKDANKTFLPRERVNY